MGRKAIATGHYYVTEVHTLQNLDPIASSCHTQLWEVEGGVASLVPMAMDKLFNSEKHAAAWAGPGNKLKTRVLPVHEIAIASIVPSPAPLGRLAQK